MFLNGKPFLMCKVTPFSPSHYHVEHRHHHGLALQSCLTDCSRLKHYHRWEVFKGGCSFHQHALNSFYVPSTIIKLTKRHYLEFCPIQATPYCCTSRSLSLSL